jgi:hypothetical protein
MQVFVDILEVTRIPFAKLETVYFSLSFAITPRGQRIHSSITFANPAVRCRPKSFRLHVLDIEKSCLTITLFNFRTNGHRVAMAFLAIPLAKLSLHGIISVNLEMTETEGFSPPPILRMELFMTQDPKAKYADLKHVPLEPAMFGDLASRIIHNSEIDEVSPPKCEKGAFGRLNPPDHILSQWRRLFEGSNSEDLIGLFLDDVLREEVLERIWDFYRNDDFLCVSDASKADGVKRRLKVMKKKKKKKVKEQVKQTCFESDSDLRFEESCPPISVSKNTSRNRYDDDFMPTPPSGDEDSGNPRRARIDETSGLEASFSESDPKDHSKLPIRLKSEDSQNLPDISRLPGVALNASHRPAKQSHDFDNQKGMSRSLGKAIQEGTSTKQGVLRSVTPKYVSGSAEVEISKPVLRGGPPVKKPEGHEKLSGPRGVLPARLQGDEIRHESPPQKLITRALLSPVETASGPKSFVKPGWNAVGLPLEDSSKKPKPPMARERKKSPGSVSEVVSPRRSRAALDS